jgi:hypothetical protein
MLPSATSTGNDAIQHLLAVSWIAPSQKLLATAGISR